MRPSRIRKAANEAIEALVVPRGNTGDRFMALTKRPDPSVPGATKDRTFYIMLSVTPAPDPMYGDDDLRTIRYTLTVYYTNTPDVEDRIGDDADVIVTACDGLFRVEPDIQDSQILPIGVGDVSPHQIAVTYSLIAKYRRDL